MIPKIIHYCWFGGNPLPPLAEKCIESWKSILPDYQIMRWDETTYDLDANDYVREAYESRKYAFVSDYVRLDVLFRFGGIYMDTDVQVVKPLDQFLVHEAFSGFENVTNVPTGIMAAEKGNQVIRDQLDWYKGKHFLPELGGAGTSVTNVNLITDYFLHHGLVRNNTLQVINGYALYPNIVFCPYLHELGTKYYEKFTCTIHHKSGSWIEPEDRAKYKGSTTGARCRFIVKRILLLLLGKRRFDQLLIWKANRANR